MASGPPRISATAFYRGASERLAASPQVECVAGPMAGGLGAGSVGYMDAAGIDQAVALASTMVLMVLGGMLKGRLEWHRRPPFWRRWRR